MSPAEALRDSSLDSCELNTEKLTLKKIPQHEEKKLTKWTPSKNLGSYILCHVRKVSSKGDEDVEDETEEKAVRKVDGIENDQKHLSQTKVNR